MNTLTYGDALAAHDIAIPDHLAAQAEVPALAGPQRQGDLLILPDPNGDLGGLVPVPREGVQLVAGEATGNTHYLDGTAGVTWARVNGASLDVAVVDVPDGAVAYVTHTDEHGCNALAPGRYVIRRQREQADVIRVVAD